MTLHGEMVDEIKWMLVDFWGDLFDNAPCGDSNIEYKHAEKIVNAVSEKIAGELDGLPRFGLIWDERLGDVIGADINGNYISRADAIAIVRGGGLG